MDHPLWSPSEKRVAHTTLTQFSKALAAKEGRDFDKYHDLHRFSTTHGDRFWSFVWDFFEVKGTKGERICVPKTPMRETRFFPDAQLNYAENLLERRKDDALCVVFHGEDGRRETLTYGELHGQVSRAHHALKALGVRAGDRVCAVVPNTPQTLIFFLAAASLGAIWSSCSPDFGVQGILDRFQQVSPSVLLVCDGYLYNGKTFDIGEKIASVVVALPSLVHVVCQDMIGKARDMTQRIKNTTVFEDFLAPHPPHSLVYTPLPFDHPLYILYSSGTTGIPKCIVHRAGGVLLKHLTEHGLHTDLNRGDCLLYFTTCGWMMWNWMVSALAREASLILFDGSPFFSNERRLFDIADREGVTALGVSAKYLESVRKTEFEPGKVYGFSRLKTLLSTGSPLSEEGFCGVYNTIKSDLHLASISGGTDICGCFVLGNPNAPVWPGEIQVPALGLEVDVFDDQGVPCAHGKGELVCKNAFPSMPVAFWNDGTGEKYRSAYFDRFTDVWCHGDFAEWTRHGGIIIHGRSDATLNPGGVRIGTAEIYAQVEHFSEVLESVAVGQRHGDDVRILLFVRMRPGSELDEALVSQIKNRIKTQTSPRHVPFAILPVADIPKTKSGKITEIAVRDVLDGRRIQNIEALSNPQSLDLYKTILSTHGL